MTANVYVVTNQAGGQSGYPLQRLKVELDEASSSGNNTLVAANASRRIRVVSAYLSVGGATVVYFQDGTDELMGGNTAGIALSADGSAGESSLELSFDPCGHFQTGAVNRALILTSSAGVDIGGYVNYVLIPEDG